MSVLSIGEVALFGLNNATLRADAAAKNIASRSWRSPGDLCSQRRGAPIGASDSSIVQDGIGSCAADAVDQMGAVYAFRANILVLKVADRMVGTTLNLRA